MFNVSTHDTVESSLCFLVTDRSTFVLYFREKLGNFYAMGYSIDSMTISLRINLPNSFPFVIIITDAQQLIL